jgi:hypothetical protein
MATSKIIERIARAMGIPDIVTLLAERLPATDLQSLLLEVYRQRAQQQKPSAVLADYEKNRFVRPSTVSPLKLVEWQRTAFASLPDDFQMLELSPVAPLGTSAIFGFVDQNRVLATIRNTEVVSDATNVLALECAVQRRQLVRANPKSKVPVHLAASHRFLRTQHYQNPAALAHFSMISLCSAGQATGGLQFELTTLALHVRYYLRALRAFLGDSIQLRATFTDFRATDREVQLDQGAFAVMPDEFANTEIRIDNSRTKGQDYYTDLGFHIHAVAASGQLTELADGGVVNWTQALLSNAKERCVISGISSERISMGLEG